MRLFSRGSSRKEAEAACLLALAMDSGLSGPLEELRELGWSEGKIAELRRQRETEPVSRSGEFGSPSKQRKLAELLKEEFGEGSANRVAGYFALVEALHRSGGAKQEHRGRLIESLTRRMRLLSETADTPGPIHASIVIPVFNRVEYTIAAVISVLEQNSNTRYEIIVGNDASSDETEAVFVGLGGVVRCITHPNNSGFLRNCNLSAQHATGKYLVLLNNDTLVLDNWLDELLVPFDRFTNVGLVGSKLLNADGTLQEAGGIIWRDGTGWNFGRGQDPRLPEFSYLKEVDYASGAAIAVLKSAWDEVGGFEDRYTPAYFEDTDLAFTLRARGLRTLYAPAAQVIHHEGVSHGTDTAAGIKAYQVENRRKFVQKWQTTLSSQHATDGREVFLSRDRSRWRKHILVIDHYVPQFDRDAGSRTMFAYLKMFADAGLQVSLWPDNLLRDRNYSKILQEFGIEVLYGLPLLGKFPDWVAENGPHLDYVLFSRAHISRKYIEHVTVRTRARRLYYGHDLHAARLERQYAMTGQRALIGEIEFWRQAELDLWKQVDVVYYPARDEVDVVRSQLPGKAARVLTPYVYAESEIAAERVRVVEARYQRPSILFVGGFGHRPNIDAVQWLVSDIVPPLKKLVPDVSTVIAGSSPPAAVKRLAGDGVVVTDYVSDPMLEWLYRSASVAVAPLRFGAGVKGKVVEAMRFGVPVVTTSTGVQGLEGAAGFVEVAHSADEFASAVARLIQTPDLARRRAQQALDFVEREFGYGAAARRLAIDIPELAALADSPGLLRR
jgi:GT2 family glycosyltransferase